MGSGFAEIRSVIRSAVLILLLCAQSVWATCREDQVYLRGDFGQARFTVELADDAEERARGLMFRESMPSGAGMLFLYERPTQLSFWMRNTLIELDLLFLNEAGVVTLIHERAQPLDETPIPGGVGVAVLEINGGLAKQIGIRPGAEMRHPFFARRRAAWPC
jgi:uncharacterized membrane protein (UPF0127 family)